MTTFTKLRDGTWGVRGSADEVVQGAIIEVAKKSGEASTVTVSRVLWTGDGKALAAIEQTGHRGGYRGHRTNRSGAGYGMGGYCTGRDNCMCFDCGGDN